MVDQPRVRLGEFDNSWYDPGRSILTRVVWFVANRMFFLSWVPWPSVVKTIVLRRFGAVVGRKVVIRSRVNIKYPWNLEIGDSAWIGEGVWIDSLAMVSIGEDVCLSQGCVVETGNHDWSSPRFELMVKPVVIEEGAWAAVGSLLLPGSKLASHAVLGGGSVLSGETEAYGIYVGNPARRVGRRKVGSE